MYKFQSAVHLHHIAYYQIDRTCWGASAVFTKLSWQVLYIDRHFNTRSVLKNIDIKFDAFTFVYLKKQTQKTAVRQLCQLLLQHFNIQDEISEVTYPFYLKRSGIYVCYSHSLNSVSVALNYAKLVGIDIELRHIPYPVAKRFYTIEEIKVLRGYTGRLLYQLCKLLWQFKEAVIKLEQIQLIDGIKIDFSKIILQLSHDIEFAKSFYMLTSNTHIKSLNLHPCLKEYCFKPWHCIEYQHYMIYVFLNNSIVLIK